MISPGAGALLFRTAPTVDCRVGKKISPRTIRRAEAAEARRAAKRALKAKKST